MKCSPKKSFIWTVSHSYLLFKVSCLVNIPREKKECTEIIVLLYLFMFFILLPSNGEKLKWKDATVHIHFAIVSTACGAVVILNVSFSNIFI